MHKASALILVGITAGITGAGLMWIFTRGSGEPRDTEPSIERHEPVGKRRAGVPETYHSSAAEIEAVANGARRVDVRTLHAVAGETGEPNGEPALPAVGEGPTAGSSRIGVPYQLPPTTVGSIPRSRELWRATTTRKDGVGEDVEDALSAALEAATPYAKAGFHIREDYWGGTLERSPKAITQQLFRGNEYWFWIGANRAKAGIDLHIYDSEGNLTEAEHWQRKNVAAIRVVPERTGTYYLILSQAGQGEDGKEGTARTTAWAMAYGFR